MSVNNVKSLSSNQFLIIGDAVKGFKPESIPLIEGRKYLANINGQCTPVTATFFGDKAKTDHDKILTPQQFYDCIGKKNDTIFNFASGVSTEDKEASTTENAAEAITTENAAEAITTENAEEAITTENAEEEARIKAEAEAEAARKKEAKAKAAAKAAAEKARKKAEAEKARKKAELEKKLKEDLLKKNERLQLLQDKCKRKVVNTVLKQIEQKGGIKVNMFEQKSDCTLEELKEIETLPDEIKKIEIQIQNLKTGGKRRTKKRSRKLKRKSKRSKPSKKSKRNKKR